MIRTTLLIILLGHAVSHAQTPELNAHWPSFRGPTAAGVANDDPALPDRWSETENIYWQTNVPGLGWSNPIVWGNRIFLTSVSSDAEYERPKKGLYAGMGRSDPPEGIHHWLVHCLDLESGKTVWQKEVHQGQPSFPRHQKSSYASETPVTDGQRVYFLFGDLGLWCFDFDGNELWSHSIEARKTFFGYGAAASPVVHDGRVVYVYDNQEDSYITCLDTVSGDVIWQMDRDESSTWATPFVWKNHLRTEIVTCGKRRNRAYDLDGKLLWEFDGRMSNLVIPSPFASHGMLYLASGYVGDKHRPVYALTPGASGEITLDDEQPQEHPHIQWYQRQGSPYNTSPIAYGNYYYTLLDRGFLTCHDARTGEEVYGRTRFPKSASFTASPWAYNGKLFCLSEDGETFVVRAGPEFEVLHSNSLNELCLASPAIAQGKLLIRTASKLYCISKVANE